MGRAYNTHVRLNMLEEILYLENCKKITGYTTWKELTEPLT
jgi:hypothetical protein